MQRRNVPVATAPPRRHSIATFASRQMRPIHGRRERSSPCAGAARGVRLAFTFDALAGQWPYLIARDLHLEPQAQMDAILDSHFPDVDVKTLDPLFSSPSLRRLVELVINAI